MHVAAASGNLEEVEKILKEDPEQYKQLTTPSTSSLYEDRAYSGATALHYALLKKQYHVAKRLLQHSAANEIINIPNSATESILCLIVSLENERNASELAKLALTIKGIDINFSSSWLEEHSTSLSIACNAMNLEITRLLLDHGANANISGDLNNQGYAVDHPNHYM